MSFLAPRWSSAVLLAVVGCTHNESRPIPPVVDGPSSAPTAFDGGSAAPEPHAGENNPCAHLRDRLAYLPVTAEELCDAARCRSAGGECALAGRVCPSACVRRSTDSGKACKTREDCEGQCLGPANAENGQRVTGQCSPLRWNAGCFKSVRDGVAAEICVD